MTTNTHQVRFTDRLNSFMPFLLAFLGMLLITVGVAQAQSEVAANVHFATGYVAATAPGAEVRELAKGDDVYGGDRIDTADNGRVQMRFTDGGLVSLMPNTTFSVEEYLHEGKAEEEASLVFGMLKGGLRTVTGTIGKVQHDQYELKTPVATLGIRGTEYVAVLRPANTLRVHVGRGKVVITNDQGSLEVPEGRNAVVTLGSAPEFSEQGPQYQATGPMGDRLVATYQQHQDPHLLNPRANMPPLGEHSFVGVPVSGGVPGTPGVSGPPSVPGVPGVTPPLPPLPPSSLPPGTYQMAVMFPYSVTFTSENIGLEFDSVGHLSSLDPTAFDTGDWQSFNVVTNDALSWGEFAGTNGNQGSGNLDPITLNLGQYAPYVVGSAPVTLPTAGILNYSLNGATPARAFSSDGTFQYSGNLNHFNLDINLDSLTTYDLDMRLTMDNAAVYEASTTGSALTRNTSSFSFSDSVTGGNCSPGCALDVEGFFAGANAGQAGIIYRIHDVDRIIGAAGLRR